MKKMDHFTFIETLLPFKDLRNLLMPQPKKTIIRFALYCLEDTLHLEIDSNMKKLADDCIKLIKIWLSNEKLPYDEVFFAGHTAYSNKIRTQFTVAAAYAAWTVLDYSIGISQNVEYAVCAATLSSDFQSWKSTRPSNKLNEYIEFAKSLRTKTNYDKTSYMASQLENDPSSIYAFIDEVMDEIDLIIYKNNKWHFNVPGINISGETIQEVAQNITGSRKAITWLLSKFT